MAEPSAPASPRAITDSADTGEDKCCAQCLHPLPSTLCRCALWRFQSLPHCGRSMLASQTIGPGTILLTDSTAMSVELREPEEKEEEGDARGEEQEEADAAAPSHPLQLTSHSAPNVAGACVPLLVRLLALLRSAPHSARARLVRLLHHESLSVLSARDEAHASFFEATAQAFVQCLPLDQTDPRAQDAALELVRRLLSAIKLNSFACSAPRDEEAANGDEGSTPRPARRVVLLLLIAGVNHSCRPCAVLEDGNVLRSSRRISAGEQVCISYLSAAQLRWTRRRRRERLFRAWGFECECERCVEEEAEAGTADAADADPVPVD